MPTLDYAIKENLNRLDANTAKTANLFVETKGNRVADYPFEVFLNGDAINKVIEMDQSPIGKTPRSNPATYIGIFDTIRQIFASTTDAKMKGFRITSYNVCYTKLLRATRFPFVSTNKFTFFAVFASNRLRFSLIA